MTGPGKMFRPDPTGIPMPFHRQAELSVRENASRRSGSMASGIAGEVGLGAANITLGVLGSL